MINAFRAQEIEPLQGGPVAFAEHIADETAKWADVAAKAGLGKPETLRHLRQLFGVSRSLAPALGI